MMAIEPVQGIIPDSVSLVSFMMSSTIDTDHEYALVDSIEQLRGQGCLSIIDYRDLSPVKFPIWHMVESPQWDNIHSQF